MIKQHIYTLRFSIREVNICDLLSRWRLYGDAIVYHIFTITWLHTCLTVFNPFEMPFLLLYLLDYSDVFGKKKKPYLAVFVLK